MQSARSLLVAICLIVIACPLALAQTPPQNPPAQPPPPVWTGSFGAGLSMTSGNSDTTNINLSFDTKYDPKTGNLFKAEGLYLLGRAEGEDTANRLFLLGRFEHLLKPRVFVFGQLQYTRDPFKGIDYLIAPTGGIGYKLVDTPRTQLSADTSLGVVWEKNPDVSVRTSGAWAAGEKLSHKLSDTATFTESAQALWKLDDLGDAFYQGGLGLAVAITARSQLKVELQDTYKTRPPDGLEKNDVALLLSFVFKY
jgi:putative salt-induced outer membrane protein